MICENRVVAILQARMTSSRLPGKVMKNLNSVPMIERQIDRILTSRHIDNLVVATSTDESDNTLTQFLTSKGFDVFRGSLDDVFSRYLEVLRSSESKVAIRLTGDCPLVMPELIDEMLLLFAKSGADYFSNTIVSTFPDGLDIEIFTKDSFFRLSELGLSTLEREHVTLGYKNRPQTFKLVNYESQTNLGDQRWTVDYPDDFEFVEKIFQHFVGRESTFTQEEVLHFLDQNPDIQNKVPSSMRDIALKSVHEKGGESAI